MADRQPAGGHADRERPAERSTTAGRWATSASTRRAADPVTVGSPRPADRRPADPRPVPGERSTVARSRTLCVCLIPVPSAWSRSAAPATRWTPRSSPRGWRRAAGRCGARGRTRTSSWSTPAASSRRPSRTPSTTCSRRRDSGAKVAAVGCLAERYGTELAEELPEAQVLSFDDYTDIAARLDDVLAGRAARRTSPRDRRTLLPVSPAEPPGRAESRRARARRATAATCRRASRPASGPGAPARGSQAASAPAQDRLRLRPPLLVLRDPALPRLVRLPAPARRAGRGPLAGRARASARWSWSARTPPRTARTSATCACSRRCCPSWRKVDGIARVRVSYLQPAEIRPGLIEVMATTPGVVPYFDLSFQHASGPVLRRMRRFGDRERFLELLERVGSWAPDAGVRSNFIVGFPGETADGPAGAGALPDEARLDAIGVFGYSDEDGTEAAGLRADKLDDDEVTGRVERARRPRRGAHRPAGRGAGRRGGRGAGRGRRRRAEGRAAHQAPEVDGSTTLLGEPAARVGPVTWCRRWWPPTASTWWRRRARTRRRERQPPAGPARRTAATARGAVGTSPTF